MEQTCQDFDQYDESLLAVDLEEQPDAKAVALDNERYKRANKEAYKKHFGKTKRQIDKENYHILHTQKVCMHFVKAHRGHEKVCNWCRRTKAPAVRWKWSAVEKVWYRWYDEEWHYWGPSKSGFTRGGWTWYSGYWHHRGYVFKYVKGVWYRFQGKKWVRYGSRVPVRPGIPRGPRICRPFYVIKKWGFPASLSARRLPRCRVGRAYYMWKNHASCKFLGGKLVYMRHRTCRVGRPHQWARVIKCVQGPVLTHKGFDYSTGEAKGANAGSSASFHTGDVSSKTKTTKVTSVMGMQLGKCYRFDWHRPGSRMHLLAANGKLYNRKTWDGSVFKVVAGLSGKKNTISLRMDNGKHIGIKKSGKIVSIRDKHHKMAKTFFVTKGLGGKGLSFMLGHHNGYFLSAGSKGRVTVVKDDGKLSTYSKKLAHYFPKKVKC